MSQTHNAGISALSIPARFRISVLCALSQDTALLRVRSLVRNRLSHSIASKMHFGGMRSSGKCLLRPHVKLASVNMLID